MSTDSGDFSDMPALESVVTGGGSGDRKEAGPGSSDQNSGHQAMAAQLEKLREQLAAISAQNNREVVVKLPKQKKVKKFHGEVEIDGGYTVDEFVEEIGILLRGEKNSEERRQIVVSHLGGSAKAEVKACSKAEDTAEAILELLQNAFGDRRSLPALLTDFTERKQGAREGIREYANDLFARHEKLQKKQRKEGRQVMEEDVLVGQFVEGLRDKSLALDLKRQGKKSNLSFAEARREALEWEEMKGGPSVRGTAGVGAIGGQISELERAQEQLRGENVALRKELEALKADRGFGPQRGRGRSGTGSTGRGPCFRCQELGHIQRNCPKAKAGLNGKPSE